MQRRIFETIFFGLVAGIVALISTPVKGQLSPRLVVHNLNQREHFTRNALDLLVQSPVPITPTQTPPQTQVVPVTQIKLVPTKTGIQVILTTPIQAQEEILTVPSFGNESLIWIKNTRLQLPSGKEFHIQNPKPGITDIYVTQQDDVTVQVRVVGETVAPLAELVQQNGRTFVDVTEATSTDQQRSQQQKPSAGENQEPIEIDVTAQPETDYNPRNASIGTRTNTPTRDVPQVINVIPQQVIKDQHDIFLGDALKNVGVLQSFFPSSFQDSFSIRGFVARDVLTDGLRNYFGQANQTNTNNVERIEVLRGPASVLYGQGDLGGIINVVTKQPLAEPYYAGNFSVGSFNSIQPSIDLSGPLTSDKKLLYRLDGSYLSSDSFIDFYHQTRSQVAGALSWEIEKNTKLTLNASYDDNYINLDPHGLPAVGTVLPNPNGQLPRSRYLGEPAAEDPYDTAITRLSYKLEHRFNENWSVENAFQAILTQENYKALFFPTKLELDNRTLERTEYAFHQPIFMNGYDINTQVTGRFNTGSLKHLFITGLEYAWQNVHNSFDTLAAPSIDIFNPVYGQPGDGKVLRRYQGGNRVDDLGIYAQDIITLFSNLKLVLGGRYDWAGETDFNQFPNPTSTSQSWSAFSPRAGLVYQPIKPISLYASYTHSFYPQTGISEAGQPFQPEHGTQYEVGVKAEMLGDKLSANLALYQLTESNIATTDPNNPNFSILVGEERSRGVELFITGEILPGWNAIASYAYTDPRVTKDNDIPVGKLIAQAPQNQASIWTTYIIPKGNLKGVGAGLGLFYVGDRQGDDLNTYKLPSYVRSDAALYYRRGKFNAALNFQNLFDLKYFDTTNRNTQVFYGTPFTVTFTLGWHF